MNLIQDKKAGIATQILFFLIAVVVISGAILLLVKMEVLTVNEGAQQTELLNAQFIPGSHSGDISITQFQFCQFLDEQLNCVLEHNEFDTGADIYVRFVAKTDVLNGDVIAKRNYKITDSAGNVVMQVTEKNSYYFEERSSKSQEEIIFADYFPTTAIDEGEYTLDVIVENPLIDKKVTLSKKFIVEAHYEEA